MGFLPILQPKWRPSPLLPRRGTTRGALSFRQRGRSVVHRGRRPSSNSVRGFVRITHEASIRTLVHLIPKRYYLSLSPGDQRIPALTKHEHNDFGFSGSASEVIDLGQRIL